MKSTQDRKPSTLTHFSAADLNELRQQLTAWRRSTAPRSRIPSQVWKAAGKLTRSHGVSKVAGTLRLDYYKVRQHATGSSRPTTPVKESSEFVEIPWTGSAPSLTKGCTVELASARGGRMILRLPDDTALMALTQAFWKAQR